MRVCINGELREATQEEVSVYEAERQSLEYLEQEKSYIRELRTKLLSETDWTQVPDAPVDQTAWRTYRQALRDIPSQEGFPTNIVWPIKPE